MIQEPLSIVTDRELALIKCLETWFPKSRHLLCRWHVNMNVLAKTKKHFPGPVKQANGTYCRHPSFQSFLTDWNALLSCTTLSLYNELLQKMRQNHPPLAMSYCEGTWLLWKEKLVKYWVDQEPHFGVIVTSPIEGCYATLKGYLQRSSADLKGVYDKLVLFWTDQYASI